MKLTMQTLNRNELMFDYTNIQIDKIVKNDENVKKIKQCEHSRLAERAFNYNFVVNMTIRVFDKFVILVIF